MSGEAGRKEAGARRRRYVRAEELEPAGAQLRLWAVALVIGVVCGYAAVGFRFGIAAIQTVLYGADDFSIHSRAAGLNPLVVIAIPVLGGFLVGLIMRHFSDNPRPLGVSDVIHAAALRDSRVDRRNGLASASTALVTLSTGGSTGREGPAVHLAAVIASWTSDRLRIGGVGARDLLGCAVAAAVSASFNAPLAGALFALEVVLRHYAVHAFGPIVIASAIGAVISRVHLGDVTEFALPAHTFEFYAELPAFMLLGVVAGLVGVALMRALFIAERVGDRVQLRLGLSDVQRPAVAGAILGIIAVAFPHIIGVGYETTGRALTVQFDFWTCVLLAATKVVAVAVTWAGRMGGGVFSPSLMLGALTGAAFGAVATSFAPSLSGGEGLYALAGTGAVAAAVLGAPISTTLIAFELTGDYQAAIGVMVSVSLATVVAHRFVSKSFFLTQLSRGGVDLAGGPMGWLPGRMRVADYMRLLGDESGPSETACQSMIDQGAYLLRDDRLSVALPMFDRLKGAFIPVVDEREDGGRELLGALYHIDALRALNRSLIEAHREEHS